MRDGGTRPLLFLATCLGFAETTLGMLASFAGTDGTLAAVFALVSLGMVLMALVAMYFRDPAFLTFSSGQALDLRIIQELREQPDVLSLYLGGVLLRDRRRGRTSSDISPFDVTDSLVEGLENELETL